MDVTRRTRLYLVSCIVLVMLMHFDSPVCAGEGAAALRFQSPEAKEWLKDHIGKVFRDVELLGVKGKFDQWAGFIDGDLVVVYAGYQYDALSVGEIFVGNADTVGERYETPAHDGPVTIESESNGILRLKTVLGFFEGWDTESGEARHLKVSNVRRFYFDLRARRFIRD